MSPAAGTLLFGQVAGSDHFVALTDCVLPAWALQDSDCADHEKSRNERQRKERAILLASHDIKPLSEDGLENLAAEDSARGRRIAMSGRSTTWTPDKSAPDAKGRDS